MPPTIAACAAIVRDASAKKGSAAELLMNPVPESDSGSRFGMGGNWTFATAISNPKTKRSHFELAPLHWVRVESAEPTMTGEIKNKQGEHIDYGFHPGIKFPNELVVLGHGVTGNKDRPFIVALGEALAAAGVNALRISFSGNGASGGRFVDAIISKEVDDLGAVFDTVQSRFKTIGYIGHSMGGAVGVLRTSRDARIKFLVSLAGMVNTKAFAQREFGTVKPGAGFMWDEESCPLSQAYMDDMAKVDTVIGCAKEIKIPWLLVHGTEDDVVPISDSREIFAQANQSKQLVELPGSNHVFAGEFTAKMIDTVVPWITARLA
jgi:pimeloyl-ACP methyl ester carboxylesterase